MDAAAEVCRSWWIHIDRSNAPDLAVGGLGELRNGCARRRRGVTSHLGLVRLRFRGHLQAPSLREVLQQLAALRVAERLEAIAHPPGKAAAQIGQV